MMRDMVRTGAMVCALSALAAPLSAQGVVITGASSARYVDVRTLVNDSVTTAETDSVSDLYRRTQSGVLVKCLADGWCRYQRAGSPANLVALMQDLDVTAWGFGQGVSIHAQLRARTAMGDARDLWPQAQETLEALAAYVDVDREHVHAKLGRQWSASGFGFFNFDGASVVVRPTGTIAAEAYGGWTLVQGLNRAVTDEAIAAVEDIAPDERSYLLGASLRWRPGSAASIRGQYQREIRTDRAALYAERIALDAELRRWRALLSGELNYDLASGSYNEARLRVQSPLGAGFDGALQVRHYEPYFALWTIWGAFDPVGYEEARADLHWGSGAGALLFGVNGGYRRYEDTNAGLTAFPLRTDGWRVGASASMRPASAFTIDGSYGIDVGFGSSRSDGDVSLRWEPTRRVALGVHGVAFQNIYEFRLGTGRVIGGGFDLGVALRPDLRVVGDAMLYRNTATGMPGLADWNQKRGSIRLEWSLGGDPGQALGAGRIP